MNRTSIYKLTRDLLNDKKRTSIVIMAMILGVFSVSVMITSRDLLNQNLKDNFRKTNPTSFTLVLDSINDGLRNELINLPELEAIEIRQNLISRFRKNDDEYTIISLFLVEDFENQRINKFSLESGSFPTKSNEIVIERTGRALLDLQLNETYELTIPRMGKLPVNLSGIVHDPGQAPSTMERVLYGYVSIDIITPEFARSIKREVNFTVTNDKYSLDHIVQVSSNLIKKIEGLGYKVYSSNIPPPGEHVHAAQMDSFMFLIMMFGILILLLSCFLIINMVSAIMAKEIRQIGIMKAIGASTPKITFIYLSMVIILGAIATAIGTPAGIFLGMKYAEFNLGLLNFTLFEKQLGIESLSLILFMGIGLPAIIVYLPIQRASKISIQKALNDYGVSEAFKGVTTHTAIFGKIIASKSFIFSWRNVFRRKSRLVLTLIPLILGGAVFISAFNIQMSSQQTVDITFENYPLEFYMLFDSEYPISELKKVIESTKGYQRYELRNSGSATVPAEDKELRTGSLTLPLRTQNSFSSFKTSPIMVEGAWLSSNPGNLEAHPKEVVINSIVAARYPKLSYGSKVDLMINGVSETYSIIGVKLEYFSGPLIYIGNQQYVQQANLVGQANTLLVDLGEPTSNEIKDYINALESALEQASLGVKAVITTSMAKLAIVGHLVLIYYIYIILGTMILIVGALGIISTMSMNIMERKREIGILRAIGVSDRNLYKSLMFEGATIGIISWICSVIISIPVSYLLGNKFYDMFFSSSIIFTVSVSGMLIWLVVNIGFSIASVLLPARGAVKQSVNELIAYE